MRKVTVIVGVIALAVAAPLGWQIASCEIVNSEFQEDLRDVASQNATRLGLTPARTDEDFRNAVVQRALAHGIRIEPDQVMVERNGTEDAPAVNLLVNYSTSIGLPNFGISMHFSPRAEGKPLEAMRDAR